MSTPVALKNSQYRVRQAAMRLLTHLRKCHHEPPDNLYYDRLLSECKATDLLGIYHFFFLTMSPQITLHIHGKYEEFGAYKSDLEFMKIVYKFMREVLEISPCITLQQFFSSGFLLKKLDMTSRVAEELLKLDKQLGGKLMQSIPRTTKRTGEPALVQRTKTNCLQSSLSIEDARSRPSPDAPTFGMDCLSDSMERLVRAVSSVELKVDTLSEQVESRLDQLEARLRNLEWPNASSVTEKPPTADGDRIGPVEATVDIVSTTMDSSPDHDSVDEIIERLDKQYETTQRMLGKSRALQMSSSEFPAS